MACDGNSDIPVYGNARELLARYDGRSVAALLLLVGFQLCLGFCIRGMIARNSWMWGDKLLAFIWLAMTALLAWDIRPKRDCLLLAIGLAGGFVVEWWGTHTRTWDYFTAERPPVWILPSWAVAALAIDRMGRLFTPLIPLVGEPRLAYWCTMLSFVAGAALFMWPKFGHPSCWIIIGILLFALFWKPKPEKDLCIFFGGVVLGFFLEYWGTTRRCWVYYTGQVAPPIVVLAHGYASMIFSRCIQLLEELWDLLGLDETRNPVKLRMQAR